MTQGIGIDLRSCLLEVMKDIIEGDNISTVHKALYKRLDDSERELVLDAYIEGVITSPYQVQDAILTAVQNEGG